ncbi:MAG: RsmD family RNA methyltransferase [candidate division WOR-3 bacterium]
MKISGGFLKGRILKTPKGIRPAQSIVRKAIFDTIGEIYDKKVLDIFAGSGSFGFEAISRGASFCVFVEENINCVKIIEENAKNLGILDKIKIYKMDFKKFLILNKDKFDIIFASPPYKFILKKDSIKKIIYILKEDGIFILETRKEIEFKDFKNFILKEAIYGETKITYFTGCISRKF